MQGFAANELREAGFTAKELKAGRYDSHLLRAAGYTAEDMRLGNFALRELLRDAGYSLKELRAGGFLTSDFLAAPCSVTELKAAGFMDRDCTDGGLDPAVVSAIYGKNTLEQLRTKLGITCAQAKSGGLLPSECHQAGFSFDDGKALGFGGKIADWMTIALGSPYDKWN